MIILIIAAVVLSIGILMLIDNVLEGIFPTAIGGTILLIGLIGLPMNNYKIHAGIHSFEATKNTVDRARAGGEQIENAAIQLKVIEQNQWLASIQYYNGTVWDIWIPDLIKELKPIK